MYNHRTGYKPVHSVTQAGVVALLILAIAGFGVLAIRNAKMLYCDNFITTETGRFCQIAVSK